jgi:hypothetical protein
VDLMMIDMLVRVGLLVASGLPFAFVLAAFLRMRSSKLGFITIGFGILFLDSVMVLPELMFPDFTVGFTENIHLTIRLIAMVFLAIGVLKD